MATTHEEALQLLELARNALRTLYGPNAGSALITAIDEYLGAARRLEVELEKPTKALPANDGDDIFGL